MSNPVTQDWTKQAGRSTTREAPERRKRSIIVNEAVQSMVLTDAARNHLSAELDRLWQRSDPLEVEVTNDLSIVGDHGNSAEKIPTN